MSEDYQIISLNGDPEEVAMNLMGDSRWEVSLDQIDMATEDGMKEFMKRFMLYHGKASLEKDELIGFVKKNKIHLKMVIDTLLPTMIRTADKMKGGENISFLANEYLKNIKLADDEEFEKLDMRSDKLFWLIYALAGQLRSGILDFDEALRYLTKPEHKQRISKFQIGYMYQDYLEAAESAHETGVEHLMLVSEAARIINEPKIAHVGFFMVLNIGNYKNPSTIMKYTERFTPYFDTYNLLTDEERKKVELIRNRYDSNISPDDF